SPRGVGTRRRATSREPSSAIASILVPPRSTPMRMRSSCIVYGSHGRMDAAQVRGLQQVDRGPNRAPAWLLLSETRYYPLLSVEIICLGSFWRPLYWQEFSASAAAPARADPRKWVPLEVQ